MAVEKFHDMFVASAGVAGALIGLLFVAISVAHDRLESDDAPQVHRVAAAAALTAFTNALTVSLFGLIPGNTVGTAAFSVAIVGLLFVLASLVSLWRVRHHESRGRDLRNATFLLSLAVLFGLQLFYGAAANSHPKNEGDVKALAILVIVCFLIGISRSWTLIGGPSIGLTHELGGLVRDRTSHPEQD